GLHRMLGFYDALPQLMQQCHIDSNQAVVWEDEIEIRLLNNISASFGSSLYKPLKTFFSFLGNNHFISPGEKIMLVKFLLEGFSELKIKKKALDTYTLHAYAVEKKLPERIIFRILTPLTEGLFFIPPEKYSA